jgi:hypothetical protein
MPLRRFFLARVVGRRVVAEGEGIFAGLVEL